MSDGPADRTQRSERLARAAGGSEAALGQEEARHLREVERAFVDRQGRIAWLVLVLFAVLIAIIALCYLLSPFLAVGNDLRASAASVKDLVNTIVLPIVTLVLGFYFGERNRRR